MEVRGEIRTTVEYLVQLLNKKEFIDNTIDTAWLDGLIKERAVSKVTVKPDYAVVAAAIHKSFQHVKDATEAVKESFRKGQVSVGGLPGINSFDVEIAFQDIKYSFHVERIAGDTFRMTCAGNTIDAHYTVTAEGALLATFAGELHRIYGMDEPLGLRLVLDGKTILM
jgi:acetyl-CoA carboxylase/biotin carboxylase 1